MMLCDTLQRLRWAPYGRPPTNSREMKAAVPFFFNLHNYFYEFTKPAVFEDFYPPPVASEAIKGCKLNINQPHKTHL